MIEIQCRSCRRTNHYYNHEDSRIFCDKCLSKQKPTAKTEVSVLEKAVNDYVTTRNEIDNHECRYKWCLGIDDCEVAIVLKNKSYKAYDILKKLIEA